MPTDIPEQGALRRRTVLRALGATGVATLLAGCSEAEGEPGDAPGGDDAGSDSGPTDEATPESAAGGAFECADLTRGSQTFDPDGRDFQMIWDYPESFGDVERQMANTESMVGARLGHLASKQSGHWPFMIQLNHPAGPSEQGDLTDRYVEQQGATEVDPIEYDGETVRRAMTGMGEDRSWRMAIPGDDEGTFYHVTIVQSVDNDDEYAGCAETAHSVADDLMASFRPNPAR